MLTRRTKIIIIISIAILIALILLWFFISSRKKQAISPSPSPTSTIFPTPFLQYLDSSKHEALIYEDPQKNYQITKIPSTGEYFIVILNSPFSKYREAAESGFLSLLRISKEQACKLKVTISTPYFVNPEESGQIYSLGFCP